MIKRDRTLPDFLNPPVNETALSIQFAPLQQDKFGLPHYGLYWSRIRREFPKYQVMPPLGNVTEQFGPSAPMIQGFGMKFITHPEVRAWFVDDSGTRLIQVQRDRFIHNWRQLNGSEKYPRYESIKETLQEEWKRFREFLDSEGIERPQVNQCEVTYVNHIEYNKGWKSYAEFAKVIAGWSGKTSGKFLPSPEKINIEAQYLLPSELGRLYVNVLPVLRGRDMQEVLQVNLTARGAPKSPEDVDVFSWLDLGREWVVKGFADFTTESMHATWGRQK